LLPHILTMMHLCIMLYTYCTPLYTCIGFGTHELAIDYLEEKQGSE